MRQIATERVAPRAAEIDQTDEYPWDIRKLLAEQDILGLPFAEEHGGTGTGTLMLQIAVEELAKASAAVALILMVQELGTLPIQLFGSDELKQRFLPDCASGEKSPAFCLSEPDAGSDPGAMRTTRRRRTARTGSSTAPRTGSRTPASPTSTSSSRSPTARAQRISAFVVEKDAPGFSVPKFEHKLGHPRLAHRAAGVRGRARARPRT